MASRRQPTYSAPTSKREGQISATGGFQNYFIRNIAVWNPPNWQEAAYWRAFVEKQSVATICRDRIADYLNSLDWSIVARDSDQRDELKGKIKHYTKLFERGNAYYWDIDFSTQVEWFVKDLFTLPFGTASELGRLDDKPNGRVVWIKPLDGGTLAPTLNVDYPVVQSAPNTGFNPIFFPRENIARVYLSPRTELTREGWGYAPPERVWRALEMLTTGDVYYAQLLLNTPEAGILDLGDMEKTSALQWVQSLKDLMFGISALKIPVLYEHTTQAKWIPFGKPPSEIMYDSVTMKYAAILAAGYGLTLSDIGFPSSSNGGETLAGTIRSERVGKGSGKNLAKKKFEAYANRIVPEDLKFVFIDYDDERNVSKGRARLASAQAADVLVRNRIFKPSEVRLQYLADGLISIDIPETIELDDEEFEVGQPDQPAVGAVGGGSRGKSLGNPVNPSQGGQGEVIPQQIIQRSARDASIGVSKAVYSANEVLLSLIETTRGNLATEEVKVWDEYVSDYLIGRSEIEEDELRSVLDNICDRAQASIVTQSWVKNISGAISEKVLEDQKTIWESKAAYEATQKAEGDFLEGDDAALDIEPQTVDLSEYSENLHGVIFNSLTATLARYIVLVSKSRLLSDELGIDSTERVNENLRVSREIAEEVLQNLSHIVNHVYEYGSSYLSERIQEHAGS